jgi:tRNA-uridine 2-sulfurtransferase
VDSAVAAALLVRAGHEVSAAYMKNWVNEAGVPGECPWEQDAADAEAVARTLGIPFEVVDLTREYHNRIVLYLLNGYEDGVTPNPDVLCNREMKFGVFRTCAEARGIAAVATGHYARRRVHGDGSVDVLEGADGNKDQSYFLALLRQEQGRAARFPVGDLAKPRVRELAREFGLPVADKKDSQGICFIGRVKMADFLRAYVPDKPGPVVGVDGRVLGGHRGLHLYTLGQRRGIGVASPHHGEAYVVVGKRREDNALVIALDREDSPGLYARRCTVGALSWVNRELSGTVGIQARPRYRAAKVPVRVEVAEGRAAVEFTEPQRALAPGQICAFYDGEVLLGGGVFQEIEPI